MLYNLLNVDEAWCFILDELLDKQQFKDGVQHEDGVRFYTGMYHTPVERWWAGETFLRQRKKSSSSPRAAGVIGPLNLPVC